MEECDQIIRVLTFSRTTLYIKWQSFIIAGQWLVEIEVSTHKNDRLKASAVVGTLNNYERFLQWPTKGYQDVTGWQYINFDKCLNLSIYKYRSNIRIFSRVKNCKYIQRFRGLRIFVFSQNLYKLIKLYHFFFLYSNFTKVRFAFQEHRYQFRVTLK